MFKPLRTKGCAPPPFFATAFCPPPPQIFKKGAWQDLNF